MAETKTALVISAHAADFVWRCGGAIALHQRLGYEVTVACLSYGERGESAQAMERKARPSTRSRPSAAAEAENAAAALVCTISASSIWATTRLWWTVKPRWTSSI
jgi:4-oxalomesaconate hydratase